MDVPLSLSNPPYCWALGYSLSCYVFYGSHLPPLPLPFRLLIVRNPVIINYLVPLSSSVCLCVTRGVQVQSVSFSRFYFIILLLILILSLPSSVLVMIQWSEQTPSSLLFSFLLQSPSSSPPLKLDDPRWSSLLLHRGAFECTGSSEAI